MYFHTSLGHPGVLMVLEVVATAKGQGAAPQELGCGFGLLRLFNGKSEPVIWNSTGKGYVGQLRDETWLEWVARSHLDTL